MYHTLDYTKSHPFENQCRFPVLLHGKYRSGLSEGLIRCHLIEKDPRVSDDKDLSKYAGHYREIDCTNAKVIKQSPLVNQLRSGELLIGRPHRSGLSTFECFYAEITGTLAPSKKRVSIVGDFKKVSHRSRSPSIQINFQLPLSRRIFIQKDQFVIKCYAKNVESMLRLN